MATHSRKKSPFLFGFVFRIILIVAGTAMVLSYISIYVDPSKFGVPLFFGLYFIPILFINICLMIMAIINRSRSVWIPLIVILPSLLFTELFFKFGSNNNINKEGIKLKIESYNVGMFSSSRKKLNRGECRAAILECIRGNNADIVCCQEFYVDSIPQADSLLPEYKYKFYHFFKVKNGKHFGNIIFSKFSIISSGKLTFHKSTNLSIYIDIDHYGRKIRIYNNHLESYNISFASIVQRLSDNTNRNRREISNDFIEVHEKMLGSFIKRSDQVNMILNTLYKSNYPAIICGDFNDTPMSYTYHKLSSGRKDSFKESGKGFGSTFTILWPLLRIDYILFPEKFDSTRHIIGKEKFSDHYPIIAEIVI